LPTDVELRSHVFTTKVNLLILGPGGYRFGDYWRMGLPLEVLVIAVGLPMILLVWPL
jgi:di/tricarboxylate transporter